MNLNIIKIIIFTSILFNYSCIYAKKFNWIDIKPGTYVTVTEEEFPDPPQLKKQMLQKKKEMKENGYYETNQNSKYANFLLTLKQHAKSEIRAYYKNQNKVDSHLKSTSEEIPLAFSFKKLPIDQKNIIGYSPIGSFIDNKAWNGIKVFFNNDDSVCAYEFTDLNLSHAAFYLKKEKCPLLFIINQQ